MKVLDRVIFDLVHFLRTIIDKQLFLLQPYTVLGRLYYLTLGTAENTKLNFVFRFLINVALLFSHASIFIHLTGILLNSLLIPSYSEKHPCVQ